MHQRQTSTESLASVFGQALAILQGQQPQQPQPQDEQPLPPPPDVGARPALRPSGSRRRRQLSRDEEEYARKEREARSIAVEKAYVHDVYEQISQHVSEARYRAWPRVKQFLLELEPGSVVCDVGCGGGKYLNVNPNVFIIGSDRCKSLVHMARKKDHEIVQCDALSLPFGDESADAALSIAVIHHVATVERRLKALRELARVLRVGGRVMISVWAMEQRHRKFESQDVLIPWHRPSAPSTSKPDPSAAEAGGASAASASTARPGAGGDGETREKEDEEEEEDDVYQASGRRGGVGRGCGRAGGSSFSTTCTSEDDVTHYHAYTQTSDSSATGSHARIHLRRRGRHRVRGRSFDPAALEAGLAFQPYHSSSDLSSPNETCYSFFRRAIEKFSTNRRLGESSSLPPRLPWFSLGSLEHSALVNFDQQAPPAEDSAGEALPRDDSQESSDSVGDIPIELPQLEAEDADEGGQTEEDEEDGACEIPSKESTAPMPMRTIASNLIAFFWGLESKSKSLDDLTSCQGDDAQRGRSSLKTLGRASTLDESHRDDTGFARSFEMHGSATSVSSARSTRSTASVRSESSKEHARPRTAHLQQLRTAPSQSASFTPDMLAFMQAVPVRRHLGSRSWESEPHLLTIQAQGAGRTATTRIRTLSEQGKQPTQTARSHSQAHLLEKSKAMLVVESKLMKAIKEVNESDLSENSTPLNSPAPPSLILSSLVLDGSPSQTPKAVATPEAARIPASTSPRPQLVKQKQSFQFPDRRACTSNAVAVSAATSRADAQEALVDVAAAERLSDSTAAMRGEAGELSSAAVNAVAATEASRSAVWLASGCPLGPSESSTFGRQREYDASAQQGRRRNEAELHSGGLRTPRSAPPVITLDRGEDLRGFPEVRLTRGVPKQTSFNDELLSRERMRSNEYVRKTIQKQQSLPTESPRRTRSLREGLAAVGKQFDLLRAGWSSLRSHQGARTEKTIPEEEEESAQQSPGGPGLRPAEGQHVHGVASGIAARFWQSWGRSSGGDSFTHKRGVLIQPLDVRGRCEAHGLDGAARRSMFQRRRGGSSPLSPSCQPQQQQMEALDSQMASSPSLRRCCMECPGGEIIVVERERKMSRGEASDSSSKDGSIQSDTSLDSEDSCVSVIFVPHPEVRVGAGDDGVGTPVPASAAKNQRSTSNSSESSESAHSAGSGRGSPLLSPAGNRQGSPIKTVIGPKAVFIKMAPPSRALNSSGNSCGIVKEDPSEGGYPVLESIEEHQPESETETEDAALSKEPAECSVPKQEAQAARSTTPSSPTKKPPGVKIARPVRSASLPKSYELEDLPDDPALPVRLPALAPAHVPPLSAGPSRSRGSRFEYPIVRHHPLFAKQVRDGQNLSSLLLGENVRVIRRTLCRPEDVDQVEARAQRGGGGGGPKDPFAATRMRSFEIFNPETDDLDSDSSSDESEESQDSNDSVESVVSARVDDSAKSQEAQQSAGPPPTVIVTEAATAQIESEAIISKEALPGEKLKKRVEERRKVLKSLLEENETVLTKFLSKEAAEARRKSSHQTTSDSDSDSRRASSAENRPEVKKAIKATPVTSQLHVELGKPTTRRRLDKARSVSPSSGSVSSGVKQAVARQSSVPLQIEVGNRRQSSFSPPFKESSALDKERKVTLAQLEVSPSVSEESGAIRSSRESLSGVSVESFPSDVSKKSKSPSPCKSDASFELSPKRGDGEQGRTAETVLRLVKTSEALQLQGCRDADDRSSSGSGRSSSSAGSGGQRGGRYSSTGAIPKRRLPTADESEKLAQERPGDSEESRIKAGVDETAGLPQMTDSTVSSHDGRDESISKQMCELESRFGGPNSQSDSESTCGFPYRRLDRRRPGREDSVDSSSTSAKSSVQYSDTSSLLSHRFSTVSISSNVSSEVSFGNTSGSSCYLASMSSADFDDRPALASSLSLSEADEELEVDAKHKLQVQHSIKSVDFPISRPPLERLKLKSLFRKSGPFSGTSSGKGDSASPAPGSAHSSSQTSAAAAVEGACSSLASPASADRKSRSRIGTETSLDTSIEPTTCIDRSSFEEEIFVSMPRDEGEMGSAPLPAAAAAMRRSMLSAGTSQDSDESDDGGSLTHHRYYHVFREGELDYLINKYVENLHIVSSYYDHTSWCVVAEKVNVWTI